jgi:N-formylglutamate amidohydrolase
MVKACLPGPCGLALIGISPYVAGSAGFAGGSARRVPSAMEVNVSPDQSLAAPEVARDPVQRRSHSVVQPDNQRVPLVFASPHSGQDYPPQFVAASRLPRLSLRRSEDAFVDQLFGAAPACGAPLLKAHFPRVYIDPNREPFELDATMFDAPLPEFVNTMSPRVLSGLGTIARVVANGDEIYRAKLNFEEAQERIRTHYFPYHETLQQLLDATRQRFGCYLLIDCHSMPSIGGPMDADPGLRRLDIVLGDCHGTACAPAVIALAEQTLRDLGLTVRRNVPYAGGYTTRHYARPKEGLHALQIEVNRALYMNEDQILPTAGLEPVQAALTELIQVLCRIDVKTLSAQ